MEEGGPRIAGLLAAIGIVVVFAFVVSQSEFIYVGGPKETLDQRVSLFLGTYRLLDLVVVAFVVFATISCCVAMLRE